MVPGARTPVRTPVRLLCNRAEERKVVVPSNVSSAEEMA
jgi:hypothetical protein